MNIHLAVICLSAILVAGIGVTPSFAQVISEPVVISTDKTTYVKGDKIVVSGEVRDRLSGVQIGLTVTAPNNNRVAFQQLAVGEDKKFTTEIAIGGNLWKESGEYVIKVQYGSASRVAETSIMFDSTGVGGPGTTPTPPTPTPPTQVEQTYTIEVEELGTFPIGYTITGGSIKSMTPNGDQNALSIIIDAIEDGELSISLPREVIDAKMNGCEGSDEEFVTLVDLEEVEFQEGPTTANTRTLSIPFQAGDREIEIIGTCAIPEFGTIAALILAVAIISIIAVSARSRLSIMPKY